MMDDTDQCVKGNIQNRHNDENSSSSTSFPPYHTNDPQDNTIKKFRTIDPTVGFGFSPFGPAGVVLGVTEGVEIEHSMKAQNDDQKDQNDQNTHNDAQSPSNSSQLVSLPPPIKDPCMVCGIGSKYTCPGCKVKTCSLICVNQHKIKFSCNGKAKESIYVPKDHFDHNTLMDDLKLLTKVEVGLRDGNNLNNIPHQQQFYARKAQNDQNGENVENNNDDHQNNGIKTQVFSRFNKTSTFTMPLMQSQPAVQSAVIKPTAVDKGKMNKDKRSNNGNSNNNNNNNNAHKSSRDHSTTTSNTKHTPIDVRIDRYIAFCQQKLKIMAFASVKGHSTYNQNGSFVQQGISFFQPLKNQETNKNSKNSKNSKNHHEGQNSTKKHQNNNKNASNIDKSFTNTTTPLEIVKTDTELNVQGRNEGGIKEVKTTPIGSSAHNLSQSHQDVPSEQFPPHFVTLEQPSVQIGASLGASEQSSTMTPPSEQSLLSEQSSTTALLSEQQLKSSPPIPEQQLKSSPPIPEQFKSCVMFTTSLLIPHITTTSTSLIDANNTTLLTTTNHTTSLTNTENTTPLNNTNTTTSITHSNNTSMSDGLESNTLTPPDEEKKSKSDAKNHDKNDKNDKNGPNFQHEQSEQKEAEIIHILKNVSKRTTEYHISTLIPSFVPLYFVLYSLFSPLKFRFKTFKEQSDEWVKTGKENALQNTQNGQNGQNIDKNGQNGQNGQNIDKNGQNGQNDINVVQNDTTDHPTLAQPITNNNTSMSDDDTTTNTNLIDNYINNNTINTPTATNVNNTTSSTTNTATTTNTNNTTTNSINITPHSTNQTVYCTKCTMYSTPRLPVFVRRGDNHNNDDNMSANNGNNNTNHEDITKLCVNESQQAKQQQQSTANITSPNSSQQPTSVNMHNMNMPLQITQLPVLTNTNLDIFQEFQKFHHFSDIFQQRDHFSVSSHFSPTTNKFPKEKSTSPHQSQQLDVISIPKSTVSSQLPQYCTCNCSIEGGMVIDDRGDEDRGQNNGQNGQNGQNIIQNGQNDQPQNDNTLTTSFVSQYHVSQPLFLLAKLTSPANYPRYMDCPLNLSISTCLSSLTNVFPPLSSFFPKKSQITTQNGKTPYSESFQPNTLPQLDVIQQDSSSSPQTTPVLIDYPRFVVITRQQRQELVSKGYIVMVAGTKERHDWADVYGHLQNHSHFQNSRNNSDCQNSQHSQNFQNFQNSQSHPDFQNNTPPPNNPFSSPYSNDPSMFTNPQLGGKGFGSSVGMFNGNMGISLADINRAIKRDEKVVENQQNNGQNGQNGQNQHNNSQIGQNGQNNDQNDHTTSAQYDPSGNNKRSFSTMDRDQSGYSDNNNNNTNNKEKYGNKNEKYEKYTKYNNNKEKCDQSDFPKSSNTVLKNPFFVSSNYDDREDILFENDLRLQSLRHGTFDKTRPTAALVPSGEIDNVTNNAINSIIHTLDSGAQPVSDAESDGEGSSTTMDDNSDDGNDDADGNQTGDMWDRDFMSLINKYRAQ